MDGGLVTSTYPLDLQIFLTLLVAGSWWLLYRPLLTQPHYRWWAWGWTVFLVFLVSVRLSFSGLLAPGVGASVAVPAGLLQVACFTLGAVALERDRELDVVRRRTWIGLAAAAGVPVAVYLASFPASEATSFTVRTLARSPGLALALAFCGWKFLQRRDRHRGAGVWITAGGFLLYALDQALYSAGALSEALRLAGGSGLPGLGIGLVVEPGMLVADMAWEAAIGGGAILLLVEEKERLFRSSRQNERRFQTVFRRSIDGILLTDDEYRIREINPAGLDLLARDEPAELIGRPLPELVSPDAGTPLPAPGTVRERGGLTLETVLRDGAGDDVPVGMSLSAYRLEDELRVQAIVRDISERAELMEELAYRATHRVLTDLPNRQFVEDEIERALAMHRRGSAPPGLLYLDLDGFKEVNDRHGHAAGDRMLVAVADRLRELVRETELVGHPGGDEFVVLVQECPAPDDLERIARRVADAMAEPYDVIEPGVRVPASVGAARGRKEDRCEDLLRRADHAMYQAKERSTDVVLFVDA